MRIAVVVPGALRQFTAGESRIELDVPADATVGTVLQTLAADRPTLHRRIQDEAGGLRRHVNVFVGDTNVRDAELLDTPVRAGVDITVLPSVSGG
ncbi:MAG: molybdopterin synthase sulfur carrier subunit [Streptosporangiales bacterium]|nr:molybdopterin synthase sulfur carrier subunit [Streptosporangiales bacterium]